MAKTFTRRQFAIRISDSTWRYRGNWYGFRRAEFIRWTRSI